MSEVPPGWMATTLGSVVTLFGGSTPKGVLTASPGIIPFYKVADMNASDGYMMANARVSVTEEAAAALSLRICPAGTVIFPKVGGALHTNKKRVLTRSAAFDTNTMAAVPTSAIDARFLYYWLSGIKLSDYAYGSPVPQVSRTRLSDERLILPPLPEQHRIVAAIDEQFSRFDAGVAALERARRNLKRIRDALFQLTIPKESENWESVTIQDSVRVVDYRGRTPPFATAGIPHLRSFNVKDGRVNWDGCTWVSEDTYDKYMSRGLPSPGDLLFTTEAPMGEVAPAPEKKFCMAQRMMLLKPDRTKWLPEYLMYHLRSPWFQAGLRLRATGTTVRGISSRNFRPLRLYTPPLGIQEELAVLIREYLSAIQDLERALETIGTRSLQLRGAILTAAFSGDLVPQDSNDEPASVLLERLAALRATSNGYKTEQTRRSGPRRGDATV